MDFVHINNDSTYQIQAYDAGKLTINQQDYNHSVLISAHSLVAWRPQKLDELTRADLVVLHQLKADVILLGVGTEMGFLNAELQRYIQAVALPLETMTTSAACRTFHVLTSEHRHVYAALIV